MKKELAGDHITIVEVAEKKWDQFCARMEKSCLGAMVKIQSIQPGGATRVIAEDLPLLRVTLDDKSHPCNTNLVIEAGQPGKSQVTHVIIEPIHIRLENGHTSDRYHHLQIIAEDGITAVELHPGLNAGLLEGLNL